MEHIELIDKGVGWFASRKWKPFEFQKSCWDHYLRGYSGLLNAPTGSGKTYALWLPCLLDHMKRYPDDYRKPRKDGLKVIWITPLRALARDIQHAMQEMAKDLEIPWTIAIRTGDTDTSERQKQKRTAPDCLITTPESMHLLLSGQDAPNYFKHLQTVIVDEWHELIGNKRGVQVELAMCKLRSVTLSPLKVWGVSATIGNLDQAKQVLLGPNYAGLETTIKAEIDKEIIIESVLPEEVETFPWGGHLGINMLPSILPIIKKSKTTLLFTNTRSQTEIWYQQILNHAPELSGIMAMHHGSIDNAVRGWVEDALHAGKLKLVVCTSSLDLGVDFRPVDTVIQVGGPKGIARFMQRAGRSGHQPGAASKIYFVPTHSLELVEAAALRSALDDGYFEQRRPLQKSMDVLVQYLVTLATGDGFREGQTKAEVLSTYCYSQLTDEEWDWSMRFITKGGDSLGQYEEFAKVYERNGVYRIVSRKAAMRHRLSIGTIVGDAALKVKYMTGGMLGTIEETFIARLNPGDVFWFAGRNLEFIMLKEMTVLVRKAKTKKGKVPAWGGGRMPLSSLLSHLIKKKLQQASEGIFRDIEMVTIKPILGLQEKWSLIPNNNSFLIEKVKTRFGCHLFMYPFAGRFVHEVLAGLIAYRIGQMQPLSFSIAMNDYGFELLSEDDIPLEDALEQDLFTLDNLDDELQYAINKSELARRRFRDIATISGLVYKGLPGSQYNNKHLQTNSGLLFNVFSDYDPDNLLIKQAYDEATDLHIDKERLNETLQQINTQKIELKYPPQPTPFAFPIMVDGLRGKLSTEKLVDRVAKMRIQLDKYARA
ncbi:MAG: ligase-associated DNA damage response DEXH box helicase [Cyclobacteriaceae bacterium]